MPLSHRRVITKAVDYLHRAQTAEGVWFGSWGICFTYATQFALESLSLVGETYETSPAVKRACDYLISKQRADGGWGESYKVRTIFSAENDAAVDSCRRPMALAELRSRQVGRTRADTSRTDLLGDDGTHVRQVPIRGAHRACRAARHVPPATGRCRSVHIFPQFIFDTWSLRQDGSWAQEAIEGVFNKNVAIAYPNFKFSFTIWMLGRAHYYLEELRQRKR